MLPKYMVVVTLTTAPTTTTPAKSEVIESMPADDIDTANDILSSRLATQRNNKLTSTQFGPGTPVLEGAIYLQAVNSPTP